jgi:hypothetical protein
VSVENEWEGKMRRDLLWFAAFLVEEREGKGKEREEVGD